jgi:hypothetical protein
VLYDFNLGTPANLEIEQVHGQLIPKVMIDNLTDIVGLGISGGIGYLSGAQHMLVTGLMASKLGWNTPPECLWSPRGIYYGLFETRVANMLVQAHSLELPTPIDKALSLILVGKASVLYYVLSRGFEGLYDMWNCYFKQDGAVYDVNAGTSQLESQQATSLLRTKMDSLNRSIGF